MAEAKIISALRPHSGVPVAVAQSTTSPKEQKQGKTVPVEVPKLTDIPNHMDALGWKVAACIMRKWFAANAHEMTLDEKFGKVLPSQYAGAKRPDLIDTTTAKMTWVLSFERAKKTFEELTSLGLFSGFGFNTLKAREQLIRGSIGRGSSPYIRNPLVI